jgi:hypothetical protein
MRTIMQAALLFACGAALLAQQQDVFFTSGATPGMIPTPGLAGAATFEFVAGQLVGGNPVKGAPYSANAVTDTIQKLADGNRIVSHATAAVYRDGEGRERREQSIPNIGPFAAQGAPPMTIFLSDPVAGVNYSLNPSTRTAIKMPVPPLGSLPPMPPVSDGASGTFIIPGPPMPPPGARAGVLMPGPPPGAPPNSLGITLYRSSAVAPNPPEVQLLGAKVVEGVQADGTRSTLTIPAGQIGNDNPIQIVDEVWRSPDLQVIVHSEHSDPRMGTTVYSLQNISRNDPSPELFQVPSDYTVKDGPVFHKALPPPPQ